MGVETALADFLRARRKRVLPQEIGLPIVGRRRVEGLRREELATLAGISVDYYVRLEQGRDRHPSAQVVDALARALRLDPPSTLHLHRLAQPIGARAAAPESGVVGEGLRHLLDTLEVPAFVQDRFMTVLAANDLAVALSPRNAVGKNLLREAFLDPAERELYPAWDQVVAEATAGVRAAVGASVDDPRLTSLVADLSDRSALFRQLWDRHDVRPKIAGRRTLRHPLVGTLELFHEKLAVPGTQGQLLVVHHAAPGTPSQAALQQLADRTRGAAKC